MPTRLTGPFHHSPNVEQQLEVGMTGVFHTYAHLGTFQIPGEVIERYQQLKIQGRDGNVYSVHHFSECVIDDLEESE